MLCSRSASFTRNDAQVARGRHGHLLEVLGLGLLVGLEDGGELADAVDDLGDFLAEDALELTLRGARVLEHVVQQGGRHGAMVHAHLGQDLGDGEGVGDVLVPGAAHLAFVGGACELVGALDAPNLRLRQVACERVG